MDPSNEILFNSPALHSLKRQQLLILCKRYGIKQSGKNEDLVARLREYAKGLLEPESGTTEGATASAADTEGFHGRPSQQWELVESDTPEDVNVIGEGEKRSRTLSMRSLGALSTKSGASVTSSLMSIANSLKRAGSKGSKHSHTRSLSHSLSVSQPLSKDASINATSTTGSTPKRPLSLLFPTVPTVIPSANESKPATTSDMDGKSEANAGAKSFDQAESNDGSLSRPIQESTIDGSTLGDQTTVRLVTPGFRDSSNASHGAGGKAQTFETPRLKPFHLVVPSLDTLPVGGPVAIGDPKEDIGKAFLNMDTRSFTETVKSAPTVVDEQASDFGALPVISVDGSSTPTKTASMASRGTVDGLAPPSPAPFVFGSPANAVSNAQFGQAAAAVLEEMNKRLGLDLNSSAAAKIGDDGKLDFGEMTPNRRASLIARGRKIDDSRFGRSHEKEFERMESIADHLNRRAGSPTRPTTSLAGTKRKSTFADDIPVNAYGKRIINLDNPKDKPAPKRQRVDDSDSANMERANVERNSTEAKAGESNPKKGGRVDRGGAKGKRSSIGRRKSLSQAKAAPNSRMGLLRGAAKAMKNIISSVSYQPQPTVGTSTLKTSGTMGPSAVPAKASKTSAKDTKVESGSASTTAPKPSGSSAIAPKTKKPPLPGIQATRPALVPRTTAIRSSRNTPASSSTTKTGVSAIASKAANAPRVGRTTGGPSRPKIPSFEGGEVNVKPLPELRKTIDTSAVSRRSSNMSVSTTASAKRSTTSATSMRSTSGSSAMASTVSSRARNSASSKQGLKSVPEKKARDPDFEPHSAAYDSADGGDDGSRPSSPLPEPPASLSSRPLAKRAPLEPSNTENSVEGKGSLGRKPRISRSKVIAKVHASREGQMPIGSTKTPVKPAKARKSVGTSQGAKAKLLGGDAKTRVSIAAEKKKRASEVGARRRTMAKV